MLPFNLGVGGGAIDIGDNVPNSLMLDSTASQCVLRQVIGGTSTPDTSQYKKTYSLLVKRGKISVMQAILSNMVLAGNVFWEIYFDASGHLAYYATDATNIANKISSATYNDPGGYLHLLVSVDITLATAEDRVKIYVNGVRITSWTTNTQPLQNNIVHACLIVPNGGTWNLIVGGRSDGFYYFDAYVSLSIGVDGQALDPSYFGRTSADTGAWVNKTYTGTYGANGFKLEFLNGAALGTDTSGNGNNWTLNGGITSANQFTDTPTNNYCVWNALVPAASLTVGNTKMAASTLGRGTIAVNGKMYWEITSTGGTTTAGMLDGSNTATATTTITTGVTKGFRFDSFVGTFDWTTDGISWTSIATGLTNSPYIPYASTAAATTATINSGSRSWLVGGTTPPTGFKALCTANLPTPSIIRPAKYFKAKTRTGTGAAANITGIEFSPDLVWTKSRSAATSHMLANSVVGATKYLSSDSTAAEVTDAQSVTTFNADGFSVGTAAILNTNTATYIDWMLKKGVVPGIDIVTFTAPASGNFTVAHGLGVVPAMAIAKCRGAVSEWSV